MNVLNPKLVGRAVRNIDEGEEINITYIDPY